MGWAVGYDDNWNRWVGYGVDSICDESHCTKEIDRGLAWICGGDIYGGDRGCGLFFCGNHKERDDDGTQLCRICASDDDLLPFTPTPDTVPWVRHMLTDDSWEQWRQANPGELPGMVRIVYGETGQAPRVMQSEAYPREQESNDGR